jgi:DNA-binding NarL/FixJ family response regulator
MQAELISRKQAADLEVKKVLIMAKIKVLVIEDNRLLRDGTTALLNEQKDIIAISTPGNRTALVKAKKQMPDIVLLDLGLKSQNSLKVLETMRKQLPRTEIVVMDLLPSHSDIVKFFKAGVAGFVPRDATLADFLHTIRSVAKGSKIFPSTIDVSLFSQIVKSAVKGGTVDRVVKSVKLTKQEQSVVDLLAEGKGILETSQRLKVADFIVKNHVRNVLDKLALHTRLELAAFEEAKTKSE